MTVVSDVTTIAGDTEMSSTTNWTSLTGAGNTLGPNETDFYIQGSNCFSKKASTSTGTLGMIYNSSQSITAGSAVYMWLNDLATGVLYDESAGGIQVLIGDATNSYYHWYARGKDTYAYGGWVCVAVDPAAGTHNNTTGTPSTTTSYFGAVINQSTTGPSKGNPFGIDAIRWGRTITCTSTSSFEEVATTNDSQTNRWGQFQATDGGYLMQCRLLMGQTAGSSVTFTGSNKNISIVDTKHVASSFNAFELQNSSSTAAWTNIGVTALGTTSKGTFTITGGTFTGTSCSFTDMDTFTLTSSTTMSNCIFRRCNTITAAGADMTGSEVAESAVTADTGAVVWDVNTDTNGLLDDMTFSIGANAHHAIELGTTSPTSVTFTNITFTGFNASNGQNDSTILVSRTTGTVNITISGGTTPSYKTAGATVNIITGVISLTVNGVVSGDRVSMFKLTAAGGDIEKNTYTSHATSNVSGNTQFIVQEVIASDTPASGVVRAVYTSTGSEQRYAYSGYVTSTFSLDGVTLDRTYDGTDTAYVPYIDTEATSTSVSVNISYSTTRSVITKVRRKGILPFEVEGTITNANFTATAIRTFDSIVD